ncbi:hypothetical protein OE88DRAFT_19960 [Heliocybe sulcata]|uniref:Uncharacterized protein n=1 Tax=Heliocybe sulcata TaxID=5364 RepID=A0A5C3NEX8_9AGAM|nr:hypothetical protein OE88DRAFT_19960 [Heliocybe sulcata]
MESAGRVRLALCPPVQVRCARVHTSDFNVVRPVPWCVCLLEDEVPLWYNVSSRMLSVLPSEVSRLRLKGYLQVMITVQLATLRSDAGADTSWRCATLVSPASSRASLHTHTRQSVRRRCTSEQAFRHHDMSQPTVPPVIYIQTRDDLRFWGIWRSELDGWWAWDLGCRVPGVRWQEDLGAGIRWRWRCLGVHFTSACWDGLCAVLLPGSGATRRH